MKKIALLLGVLLLASSVSAGSVFAQPKSDSADGSDSIPDLSLGQVISENGHKFASNQVIIEFKSDLTKEEMQDFYDDYKVIGLEEKKSLDNAGHGKAVAKLVKTGIPVSAGIIEKLNKDSRVEFAEPDYIITIDTINTNDPLGNLLWGLDNTGQSINNVVGKPDADIDAPEAWNISTGSSNTIVGTIDTGIDYNHEDLSSNVWTNPGEIPSNGIDDDLNGYVDDIHGWNAISNNGNPLDDNGHGTHVAGTIGAVANNAKGVVGINHHVTIISCKFLDKNGSGFTSDAVECFNYFTNLKSHGTNVRVTNNSWGGGGYSTALYNSMNNGILHAVAAGNSGANIEISPTYPASYDLSNIIVAAATDSNDNYASFTNYGTTSVDIAAPGVNILSTYPGNSYAYGSGTSMATPHVAGAAALLLSKNPNLSIADVKNNILANGDLLAGSKTVSNKRLNVNNMLGALALPSIPQVSINDVSKLEGNSGTTNFDFTITRTGDTTGTSSVNFATGGGTATAGTDYIQNSGAVSFGVGETAKTVTILVNGDTDVETNETFNVGLSGCSDCSIVDSNGLGTIVNDDSAPIIPALSVSVSTDKGSYKAGSTVTISVNVKDASLVNVQGATVSVIVKDSTNVTKCSPPSQPTNLSGNASFSCPTSGYARGTYNVAAHATKSGYLAGDGATSFRVR